MEHECQFCKKVCKTLRGVESHQRQKASCREALDKLVQRTVASLEDVTSMDQDSVNFGNLEKGIAPDDRDFPPVHEQTSLDSPPVSKRPCATVEDDDGSRWSGSILEKRGKNSEICQQHLRH